MCQISRFVGRELHVAAMMAVHVLYQMCAMPHCPQEFQNLLEMLVPTVHVVKRFNSYWFSEQTIDDLEAWVGRSVAEFTKHTPNIHRRPKVHISVHTPDSVRKAGGASAYDGVVTKMKALFSVSAGIRRGACWSSRSCYCWQLGHTRG